MGRDSIRVHAGETYVVSSDQWDPGTAVKMINVLRLGGIEVERASAPFTAGGRPYAAGTFIIHGAQPFEAYARDLLTAQTYPDMRLYPGGPPKRPYDITGWTLSYQMGVKADHLMESVTAATEKVDLAPVPAAPLPSPVSSGRGGLALDPRANDSFIAVNRLLKAGDAVYRATTAMAASGTSWPAGSFVVAIGSGTAGRVQQAARSLGLTAVATDRIPADALRIRLPRIGLYHAWGGNMDEGWTRWLLEQYEFPYTSIHDADVRAGNLRSRYDVIVLPDATYDQMLNGLGSGSMPEEYTGGMTPRGVSNPYEFTASGGTLVTLDRAAELPLTAFGVPI